MKGITLKELCEEWIPYNHEAEFTYCEEQYVLQPEVNDNQAFLAIWKLTPKAICICRNSIPFQEKIPPEAIDALLNRKCFDGRSFLEIEKDVTVNTIFCSEN